MAAANNGTSSNEQLSESQLREKVLETLFPFTDTNKNESVTEKRDVDDGPTSPDSLTITADADTLAKSEDEERAVCTICLDPLETDNLPDIRGQCPHHFHYTCIMDWMKRGNDHCPICRKSLFDKETYNDIEVVMRQRHSMRPTEPVPASTVFTASRPHIRRYEPYSRRACLYLTGLMVLVVIFTVIFAVIMGNRNTTATNNRDNGILVRDCQWPDLEDPNCGEHISFRNKFGTIPTTIGLATHLKHLSIVRGRLYGTIPSEIGLLTNLQLIRLYGNNLSGAIPSEIGQLTKLTGIEFFRNDLDGTIPTEVGGLMQLIFLTLNNNELTGTIPTEVGNLTQLSHLDLSFNDLSGTIPTELGRLTRMTFAALHRNDLDESIPTELGFLSNIISV